MNGRIGLITHNPSPVLEVISNMQKHINTQQDREKVVFLHIPKTGGTTLHNLISDRFSESKICPERFNNLYLLRKHELESYDFFSGHYDWRNIEGIPGCKKIVTILRNPRDRILSLYHFWRSHTWEHINRHNLGGPKEAKTYNLEEFLSLTDQSIVANIDNALTRNLIGKVYSGDNGEFLYPESEVVDRALFNLETLHSLGVLEYTRFSIERILKSLDLDIPKKIPRERDSTYFENIPAMEKVKKQRVSLASEEMLSKLTRYDDFIYQYILNKHHPSIKAGDRFTFTEKGIQRRDFFEEGWIISGIDGVIMPLQAELTFRIDEGVSGIEFEMGSIALPEGIDVGKAYWKGKKNTSIDIITGKRIRLKSKDVTNKFGICKAVMAKDESYYAHEIRLKSLKIF